MRRSRRRVLSSYLLGGCLLVSACSAGGGSSHSSASSGAGNAGTLRIGLERPSSLDPAKASPGSQSDLVVASLLFSGLTAESPDGKVHGAIASKWTSSSDLKTWTFTLRGDVKFSNGRAVTATDVKYSLERVAKQGESSFSGTRLDAITGWHDYVTGAASEMTGIKAASPTSVEIDLSTGLAALPELVSSPVYGVVPKEAVEAASPTFASAPVGSGQFAYVGRAGDVVTLRKAPGSTASIDAVELRLYDDTAKAYDDFVAGHLDWSPVPTPKAADAIARFGASTFRSFHAELFYAFNLGDVAFSDVRFRQAVVKAIDRAAIVKAVYPDVADPLNGLVPAGVAGHVADACGSACAHDVAAAKALVAQVYPPGSVPTVHLDYATSTTSDAVAGAIESGLTAAGIPVQRRPLAADAYDAFAASGQEGLFQFGWVGLYPDADAYLVPLFVSGSRDNATGLTNANIDAALQAARTTADPAARAKAFQASETAILAQVPIVPLAQLRTKVVVAKRVHGLDLNVGGTFAVEKVTLSG